MNFVELESQSMMGILVALHFMFAYRQMVTWRMPSGLAALHVEPTHAKPFKLLALQQRFYNAFLSLGLLLSILTSRPQVTYFGTIFFLGCMTVAGMVVGLTTFRAILLLQTLPAGISLLLFFIRF